VSVLGIIISESMFWYIFIPFFIFLFLNMVKNYIGLSMSSGEVFKYSFYGVFFSILFKIIVGFFISGLLGYFIYFILLINILSYFFVANGGIDNFLKIFGILIPIVLISEFFYFLTKSIIVASYFYFYYENTGFFETVFMQFRLALIFLGILDFESLQDYD